MSKRLKVLFGGSFLFGGMALAFLLLKMPAAALAVLVLGTIVLYAIVLELNRVVLPCHSLRNPHDWVSGRKKNHSALVVAYCKNCPATFSGW